MILVVCLNPALDITHHVPTVDWAGVNRPRAVEVRPGGKGLNVARTLLALGSEVLVLGLAGGATGQAVRTRLADLGVPADLLPIAGETRRTFAVLDQGRHTCALFNEPGPVVTASEARGFLDLFEKVMAGVRAVAGVRTAAGVRTVAGIRAVVLSGSLPPGLPSDLYATLTRTARAAGADGAGIPVVLDTHGDALRLGVEAGPDLVKPNLDELEDLVGEPLSLAGNEDGARRSAVAEAADGLRAAGAGAVVVSLGPAGLRAVTADGSWQAVPPAVDAVNPTGAGDAVVAGLVHGLVTGLPWPDRLRDAAALGTAAVLAPVAGEFGRDDYTRIRAGVSVTEVSLSRYGAGKYAERDDPARSGLPSLPGRSGPPGRSGKGGGG